MLSFQKEEDVKKIVGVLLVLSLIVAMPAFVGKAWAQEQSQSVKVKKEYRFVMIPILVQAWFDQVHTGALDTADKLGKALGTKITWDYQAPAQADLEQQNQMLERAIASKPDGIAIDCNDPQASLPILKEAQKRGIPIVLYTCDAPSGSQIPYVSDNWYEMGITEGKELLKKIGGKGNVAIMGGVPTNSPHALRFKALNDLFKATPGVKVVATGLDYDDVEKAQTEAARILAAHPELNGFAEADAAGPVGVGLAIKEAGKVGKVQFVGIDSVPQLQELMRAGVLNLSVSTKPRTYGNLVTVALMMQNLKIESPQWFQVGTGYLTPDMVKNGDYIY
jgi:ribose transport system substrate-binding protein